MTTDTLSFPTLAEAIWPTSNRAARFAEAFAFSILTALCAHIQIPLPFTPVPITGQTFAVLYAGALLGSTWGAVSMALYFAEGLVGLPVFAQGLLLPTLGYLIGFIPAAWLCGRFAERGWDRSPAKAAAMMLISSLVVFACGLPVLAFFVPPAKLLAAGFLPFLPGDLFKAFTAAAALPLGWKLLNRKSV